MQLALLPSVTANKKPKVGRYMMKEFKDIFWNRYERRLRAGVRVVFVLLLFFLIYKGYLLILNSIGIELFYSNETSLWIFMIAGTVRLLPAMIVLWLGGRFIDRRSLSSFGLHFNKNWWVDFCFGIGLGAFLMLSVFVVEMGFGWISISNTVYSIDSQSTFIVPLMVFLFYFAGQGTFEELLSRGYLIKNLAEGLNLKAVGPKWAVLIAWCLISITFGLAHLGNPNANVIGALNLILMGVTFGIGLVLTGELAIPIGLHVSWNFFQANVFGFPVSGVTYPAEIVTLIQSNQGGPDMWTGGNFGPEAGLLSLFANILGLLLILVWVYIRRGRKFGEIHALLARAPEYDY